MIDDLVLAVVIDVGDAYRVSAHSRKRILPVYGIENPALGQLAVAPIPRDENRTSVIAAAHHNTRSHAIEISNGGQKPIGPVARIIIVPVAADSSPTVERISVRNIIDGGHGRSGLAVKHC